MKRRKPYLPGALKTFVMRMFWMQGWRVLASVIAAMWLAWAGVSGYAATNTAPARTNAVAGAIASPVVSAVAIPAAPIVTNVLSSVFVDTIGQGKDPFFPNSQRRVKMAVAVATEEKPTNSKLLDSLFLEGIITGKNPIVIINNTVIQANKSLSQSIKIGDEVLPVRFLELRKKSVIIAVGAKGERKEVRFHDGL